jgi:hypothetical protein
MNLTTYHAPSRLLKPLEDGWKKMSNTCIDLPQFTMMSVGSIIFLDTSFLCSNKQVCSMLLFHKRSCGDDFFYI